MGADMSRWAGLRKKLFDYMSVAQWIAFGAMMCISYIAVRHPELAASLATLRLGIMAAFFFAMLAVVLLSDKRGSQDAAAPRATQGGLWVVLIVGIGAAGWLYNQRDTLFALVVLVLTAGLGFAVAHFIKSDGAEIGEARFDTRNDRPID
jgi:hypothetical protein